MWSQWVSMWRLLKKLEIDLPYDPVIPFLELFAKYSVSYTGLSKFEVCALAVRISCVLYQYVTYCFGY